MKKRRTRKRNRTRKIRRTRQIMANRPVDITVDRPMKTTVDLLTRRPFRWNSTVRDAETGKLVPARHTTRSATWLHPSRVQPKLLAMLNPPEN